MILRLCLAEGRKALRRSVSSGTVLGGITFLAGMVEPRACVPTRVAWELIGAPLFILERGFGLGMGDGMGCLERPAAGDASKSFLKGKNHQKAEEAVQRLAYERDFCVSPRA